MVVFLGLWTLQLRHYYRALGLLEANGWDLVTVDVGTLCFHPAAINDIEARRGLVQIGLLPDWFSITGDRPHLNPPAQIS